VGRSNLGPHVVVAERPQHRHRLRRPEGEVVGRPVLTDLSSVAEPVDLVSGDDPLGVPVRPNLLSSDQIAPRRESRRVDASALLVPTTFGK
jgi:hypothetical protein